MVEVRRAGDQDVDVLCDLYRDFHEFHVRGVPSRLARLEEPDPAKRAALAARIRELMASPDAALFVAQHEDETVGFGEVYVREDEPSPGLVTRRHGHLQSMFVRGDCRCKGIGSALLDACEAWAKSVGAEELRLDIWEFPEGPLGFYVKGGYRTIRRSLIRELG